MNCWNLLRQEKFISDTNLGCKEKGEEMKINVTARHVKLTAALKKYAEIKILQVKKYTEKITFANMILNVEKDRHIAEISLSLSRNSINAKAVAGDMYAAIDIVIDKTVKQLRRHMEKVKKHRDLPYTVVTNLTINKGGKIAGDIAFDKIEKIELNKETVGEAINKVLKKNLSFWIFMNAEDDSINVVYRRRNEKFALLCVKKQNGGC